MQLLGSALGFAIIGLFMGVGKMFSLAWKGVRWGFRKAVGVAQARRAQAAAPVAAAQATPASAPRPERLCRVSDTIRSCTTASALVAFRCYNAEGIAEVWVTVNDPKAQDVLGRRYCYGTVPLARIDQRHLIAEEVEDAIQAAKNGGRRQPSRTTVQAAAPQASAAPSGDDGIPPMEDIPLEAYASGPSGPPADEEATVTEMVPMTQLQNMDTEVPAYERRVQQPPARKKGASAEYVGKLTAAGEVQDRDGDRSYMIYTVCLRTRSGEEITLTGRDLQRAIGDAQVKPGDVVRIRFLGWTKVPKNEKAAGGKRKVVLVGKKLFAVDPIKRAE